MLPTYVVARAGTTARVAVHVPHGEPVTVDLEIEGGGRISLTQLMIWVDPHDVDGELIGEATFEIPDVVPLGYHYLHAYSGERSAKAQLIVVPDRLVPPPGRHWGFMLQLYAVRSHASWGMGDLRDLRDLATWSGRDLGADFVLVNPLHAAGPVAPMEPSPYYPSSRRFVNPIYLRVDDVPEVAGLPADEVAAVASVLRDRNVLDEDIDRDAVWSAKRRDSGTRVRHPRRRWSTRRVRRLPHRGGRRATRLRDLVCAGRPARNCDGATGRKSCRIRGRRRSLHSVTPRPSWSNSTPGCSFCVQNS